MRAVAEIAVAEDLAQDHLFAVLVGQFDADDGPARHGGHPRRQRRHGPRDIVGQADHAARLEARRGFQFVHRDDGAGADDTISPFTP
jgi:hypothetical protein